MRHDEQVRQIRLLMDRIDEGTTVDAGEVVRNPTSVYVDRELAEREHERFFHEHPQVVGLSGDLAGPGAYMTVDDLGTPLVVMRGRDGVVRGFVNACRHRGARLAEGRGEGRQLTCGFHNWSYSDTGALAGVPKPHHFGGVDRSCLGLIEHPTVERHGLIWVHPQPDGVIDPDELLGAELSDELAHWRLDELVHLDEDHYDVACNWKLAMDTFGETYHFPALHRDTINLAFVPNVQCYDTFGRNHRMLLCRRDIDLLRDLPEERWDITTATLPAYWLFPNVQLLPFADGAYLVRAYPVPGEPGRHVSRISFYLRPGVDQAHDTVGLEEQRTLAELFAGIIRDEDYVMSAAQQRTAESGAVAFALFGRNEPALHHYHRTYREALGMPPLETVAEVEQVTA